MFQESAALSVARFFTRRYKQVFRIPGRLLCVRIQKVTISPLPLYSRSHSLPSLLFFSTIPMLSVFPAVFPFFCPLRVFLFLSVFRLIIQYSMKILLSQLRRQFNLKNERLFQRSFFVFRNLFLYKKSQSKIKGLEGFKSLGNFCCHCRRPINASLFEVFPLHSESILLQVFLKFKSIGKCKQKMNVLRRSFFWHSVVCFYQII